MLPGIVIRYYRRGHLVLPGVTWCYLECYLVLPGVSPGVTWALPGYLAFFYVFFLCPKITAFLKLKLFEKNNFHLKMLPGPTPVVVTCLPGPPSVVDHLGCAFHLSNTLLHAQWAAHCGYLGALSLAFALLPPPSKMSTKSCAFECVHNFLTAQSVALVLL